MDNTKFSALSEHEMQELDGGLWVALIAASVALFTAGFAAGHSSGSNRR